MREEASLADVSRPAEGGSWLDESELALVLQQSPRFSPAGSWLVPAAVLLLSIVWIASYFGVPAALLNLAVLGLVFGHLAPSREAQQSLSHWAPGEPYLRIAVDESTILVSSGQTRECLRLEALASVHVAPAGWLLRFPDAPPLWVARSGFSPEDAERVSSYLARAPRDEPNLLRAALFALLCTFSLSMTAVWYWLVR